MLGLIPISVDDRRFTIRNWLAFLAVLIRSTLLFGGIAFLFVLGIWKELLAGDFTDRDVFRSVIATLFHVPVFWLMYLLSLLELLEEPFIRGSVFLDTRRNVLLLRRRHISCLTFNKTLALADVRGITVRRAPAEDGNREQNLVLTQTVSPIQATVTNPVDAANLPAFATRFRAVLVAAGWRTERGMWMSTR